ncbi:hypothetical protein AU490_12110 [Lonsdalea populi]|uniref:Uncharacterized protein n=1 Tax=Lonsdalea populi TaxID=1172565 RepID=A0A3N0UTM9_9GAMM|nr:hypothetical protein AU499_12665 [Lonsdalea populi]RAT13561.1 hypothetical protein AU486_14430 [Lonsdalea quercina]RAT27263.1 hypothetical protein AU490_12110 [Lonsdalea populi]RAT31500.1 hypothetical protein AU491_14170 [Lonsdalea populi]RAT41031.1 hypothetical protein AU495_15265 [Lonsdalea populi]
MNHTVTTRPARKKRTLRTDRTEEQLIADAKRDFELVREHLRADPESPTGLVWIADSHSKPWLKSFKAAGSVAGHTRDRRVNVKGVNIERLRAIKMLRTGKPILSHDVVTGWPYRFRLDASGSIEVLPWEEYRKLAYGGRNGKNPLGW